MHLYEGKGFDTYREYFMSVYLLSLLVNEFA